MHEAVVVLEQIGAVAMQHARRPAGERGGVFSRLHALAAGFDGDHPHAGVVEEGMEQPQGVRAAADAGHQHVRQPAFALQDLRLGLAADDGLEIAHHRRVGMRPGRRADDVEGVLHRRDPVAQRFVHRVFERRGAARHRPDFGAEHLHPKHVRRLPGDILRPHIDDAIEVEERADRGGGDAMLAGARLRDDALFAHPPGEQRLADDVVDLMRAGVIQLVALEVDSRPADMGREPFGEVKRARPADIIAHVAVEFRLEVRIGLGRLIGLFDLQDQRHQRFGHEAAAIEAEMAFGVRTGAEGIGGRGVHRCACAINGSARTYDIRAMG